MWVVQQTDEFEAWFKTEADEAMIGGDKSGLKRFYEWLIPEADRLFDAHVKALVETPEDG
jgi:hypothetical protein